MSSGNSNNFWDSLLDAAHPFNIISKIVQFFFFGVITATPYVVKNLDIVTENVKIAGTSGIWIVIAYLKALLSSTWKGVGIGLSTVFNTLITLIKAVVTDVEPPGVGTIIFSVAVLIFATLMFYQPLQLFFNIIDCQKGRFHSGALILLISLVATLIIMSPIAHLMTSGETITSGLAEEENTVKITDLNETINETLEESPKVVNALNMFELEGG